MEATWDTGIELELEADAKRRVRRAFAFSALGHVVAVGLLMLRPSPAPITLPPAITVDLVAAPPTVAPPSAPAPAPKPAPAPPPQARILPKEAPAAVTKPAPKPAPEPIRRRPRPKEMELGDAMAELRAELGEEVSPVPESTAVEAPTELADAEASTRAGGIQVSPERLAWMNATRRHLQTVWVNPPDFVGRQTTLRVELRADGTVVGAPEVLQTSGDPYADDNAVRALQKSSPLPPPPEPGAQLFTFIAEARSR